MIFYSIEVEFTIRIKYTQSTLWKQLFISICERKYFNLQGNTTH
jgi:hypothetical protein